MTYEEALQEIGVDISVILNRFSGNNGLMEKFVRKFPQDNTFNELKAAIAAKKYDDIETTAHTLKGVSGNLGFTELYTQSAALITAIREKRFADADKLCPVVVEICGKINDILSQID
jgi:HPt (histidine-containing phosphotransfer) domain-containing protein